MSNDDCGCLLLRPQPAPIAGAHTNGCNRVDAADMIVRFREAVLPSRSAALSHSLLFRTMLVAPKQELVVDADDGESTEMFTVVWMLLHGTIGDDMTETVSWMDARTLCLTYKLALVKYMLPPEALVELAQLLLVSIQEPTFMASETECDGLLKVMCETVHELRSRSDGRRAAPSGGGALTVHWRVRDLLQFVCAEALRCIFGNVHALVNGFDFSEERRRRQLKRFAELSFPAILTWVQGELHVASENEVLFMLLLVRDKLSPQELAQLWSHVDAQRLTKTYRRYVLPHVLPPACGCACPRPHPHPHPRRQRFFGSPQLQWRMEVALLEQLEWSSTTLSNGSKTDLSACVSVPGCVYCNGFFFSVVYNCQRSPLTGLIRLFVTVHVDREHMQTHIPWWSGTEAVYADINLTVGSRLSVRIGGAGFSRWSWQFPNCARTMRELLHGFTDPSGRFVSARVAVHGAE